MASESQSSGGSASQSQSTSESFIPDFSETPILESIAQQAQQMSGTVYNWGMDRFNKNQGDIDGLMRDALSYASPQRISADMGMAEAGVQQGAERGRQSAIQDLQSFGIDPSSGRYEALDSANRVMSAAAAAGAGNQQRMADQAAGNVMRNQAIAASNQNAQFGLGVGNSANAFLSTAMNLKYPPLGTHSQSTSQSASAQQSTSQSSNPPQQPQQSQQPRQQQQAAPRPAAPAKPQPFNEDKPGAGGGGGDGGKSGGPGGGPEASPEPDPNAPEPWGPGGPLTPPETYDPNQAPPPGWESPAPPNWPGDVIPGDPGFNPENTTPYTPDQTAPPIPATPDSFQNLTPPDEQGLQPPGPALTSEYNPYQDSPADTTALAGDFQAIDPVTGQPIDNPLQQGTQDQAGSLYGYDTTAGNWLAQGQITPTGYNPADYSFDGGQNQIGAAPTFSDPTAGTSAYDFGQWTNPYQDSGTYDTSGANFTDPYQFTGDQTYTDPYAGYDFGSTDYTDPYANTDYTDYTDPYANVDYTDPYANTDFTDYTDNTDYTDYTDPTAGNDYSNYGDSSYTDYTDPTAGDSGYTDYGGGSGGGGDYTDYTDYSGGGDYSSGGDSYAARGGSVQRGPGRRARVVPPPMQTGYRAQMRPPGFARGGPLMMAPGSATPPPGGRPMPPPGAPRPARGAPMMAPGGPQPGPMPRGPMMPGNFISANGMPPPTQGGVPYPQQMAQGGQAGRIAEPTTGGFVSRSLSPSGGSKTDDVQARLNAGEFVIPKDVAEYQGKKFFYDLIAKARRLRATHAGSIGGGRGMGIGYGAGQPQ